MNTATQAPDQLFGYEVVDSRGNKIGKVDSVWVDDASEELEFIGLKTGWLLSKTHVIPAADAQLNAARHTLRVAFSAEQIKEAPSFATDSELGPEDESLIYTHFGMDRSPTPGSNELPATTDAE